MSYNTNTSKALEDGGVDLPSDLDWRRLQIQYEKLLQQPLETVAGLQHWISGCERLNDQVSEAFCWLYIHLSRDSSDEQATNRFHHAIEHIAPGVARYEQLLYRRLVECPLASHLDPDHYRIHLRRVQNAVQLFRKENIPLDTRAKLTAKEYGRIFSQMTVGHNGRQLTLQKATALLEQPDRGARQRLYREINQRILRDNEEVEELFDELLLIRQQIARNAGFANYRDYVFRELERFDYSYEDCYAFHESIREEILPILDNLYHRRRVALGLPALRPWDLNIDAHGREPMRPFHSVEDLLEKGAACLDAIHPLFGSVLRQLRSMGHLDLESRPGKRQGAYNIPLFVTGVPFVFMNASDSPADIRTLMHESGHAVHSYLHREEPLSTSKRLPSEISELAAMSMELLSMEHWDVFFADEGEQIRARINQLEMVLKVLPWIATIDKFQHWIYTHHGHSRDERRQAWRQILYEFTPQNLEYSGLEDDLDALWLKQLHLFEAPFYYIEYGFAQIGAIGIWRAYRQDPAGSVDRYQRALRMGYTDTVRAVYETAGVPFDFSRSRLATLGAFVREQIEVLFTPS